MYILYIELLHMANNYNKLLLLLSYIMVYFTSKGLPKLATIEKTPVVGCSIYNIESIINSYK